MNLMWGSEASQAQELQDDVAGVASIKQASVLVTFLLREARLVHGAALCGGSLVRNTVNAGVAPPSPHPLPISSGWQHGALFLY